MLHGTKSAARGVMAAVVVVAQRPAPGLVELNPDSGILGPESLQDLGQIHGTELADSLVTEGDQLAVLLKNDHVKVRHLVLNPASHLGTSQILEYEK